VTGDEVKTEAILKQYALSWNEFTYIYVLDENVFYVAEWQKRPIQFDPGIRKFEESIVYGEEEFGHCVRVCRYSLVL
jgi:hypothetical protein